MIKAEKIGVIAAMQIEIDALKERLEDRKVYTYSGIEYVTGKLHGKEIIAADGLYDDVYDLQISADGTVVSGYGTDRIYRIYQIAGAENAAAANPLSSLNSLADRIKEQSSQNAETTEQPAVSGALLNQPTGDSAQTEQPAEDGSWKCSNGHTNTGKFCSECGEARPVEETVVKCAKCGYLPADGKAPKFCPECGTAF